jgi:hypothetical protein
MRRFGRTSVAMAFLALSAAACSAAAESPERKVAPVPAPRRTDTLPRLVFFMNPGGGPCQIQDPLGNT